MIISIDGTKAFDKNSTSFDDKNSQQIGYRENLAQHSEGHLQTNPQLAPYIMVKTEDFPLDEGQGKDIHSYLLFNIVLEVLAIVIGQEEKRKEDVKWKKGSKVFLFADGMLHILKIL